MNPQDNNILVGIDFSAGSERALTTAAELAQRLSTSLRVVHVFEPLLAVAAEPPRSYLDLEPRLTEARVRQRNQCTELCERLVGDRVPYTVHTIDAMALDGLLEAIGRLKPSMVVVGSHGRSALSRLLMGSVSAALCRHSPVPVVVVPPAEQVAVAEKNLSA